MQLDGWVGPAVVGVAGNRGGAQGGWVGGEEGHNSESRDPAGLVCYNAQAWPFRIASRNLPVFPLVYSLYPSHPSPLFPLPHPGTLPIPPRFSPSHTLVASSFATWSNLSTLLYPSSPSLYILLPFLPPFPNFAPHLLSPPHPSPPGTPSSASWASLRSGW